MPPSITRRICDVFLDLSSLENGCRGDLDDIIKQVSANPRYLQLFLEEATAKLKDTTTENKYVILRVLQASLDRVYAKWKRGIEDVLGQSHTNHQFKTFLALAFFDPGSFGGSTNQCRRTKEKGIYLEWERVRLLNMSGQILEHHKAGALHVRDEYGRKVLLLKPRGFIARYLRDTREDPDSHIDFSRLRYFPKVNS